jgi:protein-disulfide isomerase
VYLNLNEKIMEGKNFGCCKFGTIISIVALIASIASYLCPKKESAAGADPTFDEKVKRIILDVIKQNPQMLMDAMGEGIAKKREDAVKQLEKDVLDQKTSLLAQSLRFGNSGSDKMVLCFFDPLCKHCIEFQKSMIKIVKSGKNVSFGILPVAVLGDDSVLLAKVYISVYERSVEKAIGFIEAITEYGDSVDKDAIEKALKTVGLSFKEIENALKEADKKLGANGVMAEKMKVPIVPAIFYINGANSRMIQTTSAEQLDRELELNGNGDASGAAAAATAPEGIKTK